jgi:carboxypeptidase Taq
MYAAQFTDTMEREIPDMWEQVSRGELLTIKEWLGDRIHRFGKMRTPSELITSVTGKSLDPQYLVSYLRSKYSDIYRL